LRRVEKRTLRRLVGRRRASHAQCPRGSPLRTGVRSVLIRTGTRDRFVEQMEMFVGCVAGENAGERVTVM
jgi:hypothetical protein